MDELLTERVKTVLDLADRQASRLKRDNVESADLLVGLLQEGTGVGANVLRGMGVSLEAVLREVGSPVEPGSATEPESRLPLSSGAKGVLDRAAEESRKLEHNWIGTEHLLLGLLAEGDGALTRVLAKLGIAGDEVRDNVLMMLRPGPKLGEKGVSMFEAADGESAGRLGAFMGPTMVDVMIRQAIQGCWFSMPKEARTEERVAEEIRRIVERALKDMKDDAGRFGM